MASSEGPVQSANEQSEGDTLANPRSFVNVSASISSNTNDTVATVKKLEKAAHSSIAALQSNRVVDGMVVNSFSTTLDELEAAMEKVKDELRQHRAEFVTSVRFAHNAALPVMRLPYEVLSLVVSEVARVFRPHKYNTRDKLGWIVLSHVCTAWRRVIISLGFLWARELCSFRSPESFHTMLSRARQAPLTLKNEEGLSTFLPEHYWSVLLQSRKFQKLELYLQSNDIAQLADILHFQSSFKIESLDLNGSGDSYSEAIYPYPVMAPISNLRRISFNNLWIPFQAPALTSLFTSDVEFDTPVGVPWTQFLDVFRTCSNLTNLHIVSRTFADGSYVPLGKVQLPHLQTLTVIDPRNYAPFIHLLEHLELPELTYLMLYHENMPARAAFTPVLRALLSSEHVQPFIRDTSRLSIAANHDSSTERYFRNGFSVRLDDGQLTSMGSDDLFPEETNYPETRRGMHLSFGHFVDEENEDEPASFDTLFRVIVAGWLELRNRSTSIPAIRSAYFNSRWADIDWEGVLQPLADVDILYIPELPYQQNNPVQNRDDGLLSALSKTSSDGTMLLPRLSIVLCEGTDRLRKLAEPDDQTGVRASAISSIRKLLSTRAAHGTPLTRIKYGSAAKAQDVSGAFKEADAVLHRLVSSYL